MFKRSCLWAATMAWHLWRIVTLRPAFKCLSDSGPVVRSFISVYFVAGLVRWGLLYGAEGHRHSWLGAIIGLVVYLLLTVALFERRARSSALTCAVLGCSAIEDLAVAAMYLAGLLSSVKLPTPVELGLALVSTAVMVFRFHREPAVVRKSGYRLSNHPELQGQV
ncbi:hypothetical protein KTD31_00415 [Burkholderia multivorans]|uniref:hypothetical protein n=1 Tax=Burkholderia multivorans TaxID=87883 RepID=UPI001C213486|nr:hypothetical protein [Burkholderia multivorans]MBU9199862.1 hypothetical protein [Burkholderia multivorans]MDN8079019.1 hypothetical protein [Burkholderia multivorans]